MVLGKFPRAWGCLWLEFRPHFHDCILEGVEALGFIQPAKLKWL